MFLDASTLVSLAAQPLEIVTYLVGAGWKLKGATDDESLWVREVDQNEWQLIAPIGPPTAVAARRMSEALSVLSAVEGRSAEELADDVEGSQRDKLRLRTFPIGPSGSAPLREAIELASATRELLIAGAASVDDPREIFASRKVDRAVEYADSIAVSTEPGSFVLALETPVAPSIELPDLLQALSVQDGLFPDAAAPFNRRATERVVQAAAAASRAASAERNQEEEFADAVPLGVSANFLEALAAIGGVDPSLDDRNSDQLRRFDLSVRWSYGRPSRVPSGVTSFPLELIPVFSSAAQAMRVRNPEPDTLIQGRVRSLRDEADGGTITVEAEVRDGDDVSLRQVRLRLLAEDYSVASSAHASGNRVRAQGELHRGGQLSLRRIKLFQVVEASAGAGQ